MGILGAEVFAFLGRQGARTVASLTNKMKKIQYFETFYIRKIKNTSITKYLDQGALMHNSLKVA
jgi:hypothetical protein